MKKLFVILFLSSIFTGFSVNPKVNTGYITLKYYGDVTKPYPEIIFYLPGAIDTTSEERHYIKKIEVNESEFEGIRKAIERREYIKSDTLSDYLAFSIFRSGEESIVLTKNKATITRIVGDISKQFKGTYKSELLEPWLSDLLRRLGVRKESNKPLILKSE